MAVLNQLRLPNGQMVRVEEWCELPIHSSADLQVNAGTNPQEIYFFNYGEGDNYPGTAIPATKAETNLDKGAQLLSGEMFVFAHTIEPRECMTAAGPLLYELSREQLKETFSKVWAEWKLANKIFWEGKIPWTPQGGGIHGIDQNNLAVALNNGAPAPSSMRRFTIPTHISASNEVIRGLFRFLNGPLVGSTVPGLTYYVWTWIWKLEGLRRRQVV
jgi:hypothetical protein